MLRKWSALVLLSLALPVLAFAQNTGKLAGRITDASTGEGLPSATVIIQGTTLGAAADVDGNFFIIGVPVGTYNVQVSFIGYQNYTETGVEINAGYTREFNVALRPGVELDEIFVEYERPLIQKDAIGVPKIVSAEDISNLPVRGAAGLAAIQGGVVNQEGSSNLFIRGGREQEVTYYVDGVRVVGGANLGVPSEAIQEQEMLIGSIPARYGDAMSGVISITTKSGSKKYFGSIEGITSEVLDSYGYNNLAATLGGPIGSEKINFFIAGEYSYRGDADPNALGYLKFKGNDLVSDVDFLRNNPQAIAVTNDQTGEVKYISVPGNLPKQFSADSLKYYVNVPEGYTLTPRAPINAANTFREADFDRVAATPGDDHMDWNVNGNIAINPLKDVRVRVGGSYNADSDQISTFSRSLFATDKYLTSEETTARFFGSWTHYLSNATFYQVQVDYSDYNLREYMDGFSKEVGDDLLLYGDIDHEFNAQARNYLRYNSTAKTYSWQYRDGDLPGLGVHSLFRTPGTIPSDDYEKRHQERFSLSANATTQVGLHQIEFGGTYEQRTQRRYNIGVTSLARHFQDGNVETLGASGEGVASWNDFEYDDFHGLGTYIYYGYNHLGTKEVDTQDIDAFGNNTDHNIAPFQPIYYAGYITDKLEYRDIVLQVGLRADVYDSNSLVLYDRYALLPIVRAGDVSGTPSGIGSDYAVYYNTGDEVVGYRDRKGNFYNAQGGTASAEEIRLDEGGQVKDTSKKLTQEVFTDFKPKVVWQPRIGLSFPVTDQALFFASFDILTQRPSENVYETISKYRKAAEESERIGNPDLKPEKTTQYELGFRQRLGERAALQISGFYKDIKNKIALRIVPNAYPNNYQTYGNVDFGTVRGVEVKFEMRRTNNLQLDANYTLSFASGTGGDAASTAQIVWRQETLPFYPRFISPLDFDQRHRANVTLDYRLGQNEGPMIGGTYPLSNFGVNLVATAASGFPYTRRLDDTGIHESNSNGNLLGGINQENQPSTLMLNLRLDRRFNVGKANMTAFVWIQNLLDSDNINNVYSTTGSASTDGWVAAHPDYVTNQGDLGPSFIDYYGLAVNAPANYGIPRQTRLGLRLTF